MVGVNYQRSNFDNNQTLPHDFTNSYLFENILPIAMLNYKFSKTTNIRMFYRTNTNLPSVDQLQDVVDNTNPLYLTSGNPALKQEFSHNLFIRFSNVDAANSKMFFAMLAFNIKNNYIANSTYLADSNIVIDNINLNKGVQFIKPVNLDGYLNIMSFINYGFPFELISSNLNLTIGGIYTKYPGLINNIENMTNSYNANCQLTIASNISENLDFTISTRTNYNYSKNNVINSLSSSYFNQLSTISLLYQFWEGFFIQADVQNNYYKGISDNYEQNITLLNFSIGKKFFENETGELKIGGYDLLNQNQAIQRNITNLYIENSKTQTLQRYFLLTFTYYLRKF